jgi:hypothetical protein
MGTRCRIHDVTPAARGHSETGAALSRNGTSLAGTREAERLRLLIPSPPTDAAQARPTLWAAPAEPDHVAIAALRRLPDLESGQDVRPQRFAGIKNLGPHLGQ